MSDTNTTQDLLEGVSFQSDPAESDRAGLSPLLVIGITFFTMLAFAGNSILGRSALKPTGMTDHAAVPNETETAATDGVEAEPITALIDPGTYTLIRIAFGAVVLLLIQAFRKPTIAAVPISRKISAAFALTVYAVGFSFAYVGLDAASGTLILFAFVQLTMLSVGMLKGDFPSATEWTGLVVAMFGLVYLVLPKVETPLIREAILMAFAGIAWGFYSVLGKGSTDSITDTSRNFSYSVPLVLLIAFLFHTLFSESGLNCSWQGFGLAAASGAIASGLGYVLWYTVLPFLKSSQAAAVQLSVPIIAAVGGALFSNDPLTQRTILSGAIILSGIALTVKWKKNA